MAADVTGTAGDQDRHVFLPVNSPACFSRFPMNVGLAPRWWIVAMVDRSPDERSDIRGRFACIWNARCEQPSLSSCVEPRTLCYGQRAPICYHEVAGPADPLRFRWPNDALVAQLDRAPDFESGGRGFESLR